MSATSITVTRLARTQTDVRQRFRTDILAEATAICAEELTASPDTAHLLHLRGRLAMRDGQHASAMACFRRALSLAPSEAEYSADLGEALGRVGRVDEALAALRRALELAPGDPRRQIGVARALVRRGEFPEAHALYESALRSVPDDVRVHVELGDLLEQQNHPDEALAEYEHTLRLAPSHPQVYMHLGRAWLRRGDWRRALSLFETGLLLPAALADLHCGVGDAHLQAGSFEPAAEAYRAALAIDRYDAAACQQLVVVLELLGRRDEAVEAWCAFGAALERHGRHREAADAYATALARKPDCLRALVAAGWIHTGFSRFADARVHLETAVQIAPNHFSAHMGLLAVAGLTGDYERAMKEFEWTEVAAGKVRVYEQPRWDGSPLEGRTILLWEDAGFGDVIQRMRFIPLLKALGARIVVESPATLMTLFEQMKEVDRVVASGTPLPPFDVHSPLSLLASTLRITLSNLPNRVPYIFVPPDLRAKWRARLNASQKRQTKIGLVWGTRSAEHGKSAPLAAFGPLARIPHVRFISLQLGPQTLELIAPPEGLRVDPFVDDSFSVADTAATIENLDLVMSVDTMVAHLAGALGRPTWLLLTALPEWRWLNLNGRSPWYPTMRLFQQSPGEGWFPLLERVATELAVSLAEGHFVSMPPVEASSHDALSPSA